MRRSRAHSRIFLKFFPTAFSKRSCRKLPNNASAVLSRIFGPYSLVMKILIGHCALDAGTVGTWLTITRKASKPKPTWISAPRSRNFFMVCLWLTAPHGTLVGSAHGLRWLLNPKTSHVWLLYNKWRSPKHSVSRICSRCTGMSLATLLVVLRILTYSKHFRLVIIFFQLYVFIGLTAWRRDPFQKETCYNASWPCVLPRYEWIAHANWEADRMFNIRWLDKHEGRGSGQLSDINTKKKFFFRSRGDWGTKPQCCMDRKWYLEGHPQKRALWCGGGCHWQHISKQGRLETSASRIPSEIFLWFVFLIVFLLILFVGCASHTLHLLAKDLLAPSQRNIFEPLVDFILEAKDVVTCFTRSHLLHAQLTAQQKELNLTALIKQCPTRWCTIRGSCQSLLASESVLHKLVSGRDFMASKTHMQLRSRVRNTVMGFLLLFSTLIIF